MNNDESIYKPNTVSKIPAIFSKLILPSLLILATKPSKSSVVAFPIILGPTIPNTVLANAKNTINMLESLYCVNISLIILFNVPEKLLAFSIF